MLSKRFEAPKLMLSIIMQCQHKPFHMQAEYEAIYASKCPQSFTQLYHSSGVAVYEAISIHQKYSNNIFFTWI